MYVLGIDKYFVPRVEDSGRGISLIVVVATTNQSNQ